MMSSKRPNRYSNFILTNNTMNNDVYAYQRIFRSRKTRMAILKALSFVPDTVMLALQYRIKLKRWPDFKHPTRWTEKLQVYKMQYRDPVLHTCVDKYEVRNYVRQKGLESILTQLYGVYETAEEMDLNQLPDRFVLKTTDGGGGNNVILVQDKNQLDIVSTRQRLNSWLNIKDINAGREWAYTGIRKSQIIAEELLINPVHPEAGVEDFKILCFHGEPKYIIVDKDRYIDHKRNFYTPDWKKVDVTTDHDQFEDSYPKPKNLDKMLDIARTLSESFPFVRVDLYNIEGKIYFGELTFYPWSGYVQFTPDEFDTTLGQMMNL